MWSAAILRGSFSWWQLHSAATNNACSKDGCFSQCFNGKPGCKTCVCLLMPISVEVHIQMEGGRSRETPITANIPVRTKHASVPLQSCVRYLKGRGKAGRREQLIPTHSCAISQPMGCCTSLPSTFFPPLLPSSISSPKLNSEPYSLVQLSRQVCGTHGSLLFKTCQTELCFLFC